MTQEEFDNTDFCGMMGIVYKGDLYSLMAINLEERLLGFNKPNDPDVTYARCENCELNKD